MEAFITIIRQFGQESDRETMEISVANPSDTADSLEGEVRRQVVAILKMDGRGFPVLRAVCQGLGVWNAEEEKGEATPPDELAARILNGFGAISGENVQRRKNKFRQKICGTVHRARQNQV